MIRIQSQDEAGAGLSDLAPDLTPMLDILFILLVFFMLTAGSVFQALDLTLPEDVTETVPPLDAPRHIMLEINETAYRLDGKEIKDFDDLKAQLKALRAARPEEELVIAGDRKISVERFLDVLTYLQSQDIKAANILMTRGSEK
ncbi:MAG: biopolymer transporter ExbD [Sneathiella sp.]